MIASRLTLTALVALCSVGSLASAKKLRAATYEEEVFDLARGLQSCALENERSQECGAIDTTRPELCCDGLECLRAVCVVPQTCSPEGEKAKECGVKQDRPDECCEGLACDPAGTKTCVPGTPAPTVTPFIQCAAEGEKALDCGATGATRPQSCCETLECNPRTTVFNCIDPLATAAPVDPNAPEPTDEPEGATPEPTAEATTDDTPAPTPAVTEDETPAPTAEVTIDGTPEPTVGGSDATVDPDATPMPTVGGTPDGGDTPAPTVTDEMVTPPPVDGSVTPPPVGETVEPTLQPTDELGGGTSTAAPTEGGTEAATDPDVPPPPAPSSASSLSAAGLALGACLLSAPLLLV